MKEILVNFTCINRIHAYYEHAHRLVFLYVLSELQIPLLLAALSVLHLFCLDRILKVMCLIIVVVCHDCLVGRIRRRYVCVFRRNMSYNDNLLHIKDE